MTSEELGLKVTELLDAWPHRGSDNIADEVIALVRAETLEEAARMFDECPIPADRAAAAIRALGKEKGE